MGKADIVSKTIANRTATETLLSFILFLFSFLFQQYPNNVLPNKKVSGTFLYEYLWRNTYAKRAKSPSTPRIASARRWRNPGG
jgi:hypothetical protein